jgi:predicted small lipoprotein YifL
MLRACWIIALLSLGACDRKSPQQAPASESAPERKEAPRKEDPPVSDGWSPVVKELQIKAVVPTGTASPGSGVPVTLMFRSTGEKPRRIYLIKGEPFRTLQSTFFLDGGAAGQSMQPQPQPHGYIVTEADFHPLAPGQTLSFTQTLQLPEDLAPGTYSVRWEYRNEIERWEGGSQTLDGYTKALFGGKPIPGIWVGKVEFAFEVVVGGK